MKPITFTIEETKIETIIKLVANKVLTQGSHQYNNIDEAKESPLAQQLFHLPFIKRVFISANFIALERFAIVEWNDVQHEVKEEVETYLNNGGVLITNSNPKKIPVEIYAEATPNPDVIKFVCNKMLVKNDVEIKNKEEANISPLAIELFNFPFVKEVFLSQNYVSITKNNDTEWDGIINEVRSFIRNFIANGNTIITKDAASTQKITSTENDITPTDLDEVSKQIMTILHEHVRPAVASDGGNIMFQKYNTETQNVHVVLQGACSGCPSSTITLKNGIENMLKQMLPGKINEVVAVNQ